MGLKLEYNHGQSPLEEDEVEGLRVRTISTRGELDEFEQSNIERAVQWTLKKKFPVERILTIEFIKEVHRQMFSEVWEWAGVFRKTNKNLGVDKYMIEQQLKSLVDDCVYWVDNKSFSEDEIAVRFKHRLVSIHPFPNGNGRHSRLCADTLVSHGFGGPVFSWSGRNLVGQGEVRTRYLEAIRQADQGILEPLITFARS